MMQELERNFFFLSLMICLFESDFRELRESTSPLMLFFETDIRLGRAGKGDFAIFVPGFGMKREDRRGTPIGKGERGFWGVPASFVFIPVDDGEFFLNLRDHLSI